MGNERQASLARSARERATTRTPLALDAAPPPSRVRAWAATRPGRALAQRPRSPRRHAPRRRRPRAGRRVALLLLVVASAHAGAQGERLPRVGRGGRAESRRARPDPAPPPPPSSQSLWRWRERARANRYATQQRTLALPAVDWSRHNLQILFVDHTGATRARLAAGLAERAADWCGLGLAVAPEAAGLVAGAPGPAAVAAVASQAARLGLRARPFVALPVPFEPSDLDVYDLVVAIDGAALAGVLEAAGDGAAFYRPRIASLASFVPCRGPRLLSTRASDTLDPKLAALVAAGPPGGRPFSPSAGAPPANHSAPQSDFDAVVWHLAAGVGGLVQYLGDALAAGDESWL